MLKYALAGAALKAFSANTITKSAYRRIGNVIGERKRLAVDDLDIRIGRGDLLLDLVRKHDALRDGDRLLEIGTGWMHFYALYLRLFQEIEVTTLDIWDNRQFRALQACAAKLKARFEQTGRDPKAVTNLRTVIEARDFEDMYDRLGMRYVIEPTGSINRFHARRFDFITSMHVLEHVPTQYLTALAADMYRTLEPGSVMIHQIGIDDHLAHYDAKANHKQYLRYPDWMWRLCFQNDVQYFNRVQTSEWLKLFEGTGFELVEQVAERTNIERLKVASRFQGYPRGDLECTILTLVHRKPR